MNFKKLPKQDEVETTVSVVEITDENRAHVLEAALSMYLNEPCRICGLPIQESDLKNDGNGAVYAGYSHDNKSRTAHKHCWIVRPPQNEWAYPLDAQD